MCISWLWVCLPSLLAQVDRNSGAYKLGQLIGFTMLIIFVISMITHFLRGAPGSSRGGRSAASREEERQLRRQRLADPPVIGLEKIERKSKPTVDLLKLISEHDDFFLPRDIRRDGEETFVAVQDFLTGKGRSSDLEPMVVASQIEQLVKDRKDRDHPAHKIPDVELDRISIVHFCAVGETKEQTVSIMFTGILSTEKRWQQVWTFRRTSKRWKLMKMRPSIESDALAELNRIPAKLMKYLKSEAEFEEMAKVSTGD